jgi:glutathione S-transferase
MPGPDGSPQAAVDSTPLIRQLETMYSGRSVIPGDPALAFVDALLEDYADEWLTKAMFHYRWAFAADVAHAGAILPRWSMTDRPAEELDRAGQHFSARQVGRLGVVGSSPATAALIEASYERLLALLDARLTGSRFVMGGRPGAADFALYGQLTQLAGFDPTARATAMRLAPRVVAWVDVVEDLSGLEPRDDEWIGRDAAAAALRPLLAEVGRVYVPFLLANGRAMASGNDVVTCRIDGGEFTQKPFPYQAKCLNWLRDAYAGLRADDRAAVDRLLDGTGCQVLFDA